MILYGNALRGNQDWHFQAHLEHYCPSLIDRCVFTSHRSLHYASADLILWNAGDLRHAPLPATGNHTQMRMMVSRDSVSEVFGGREGDELLRSLDGRFDATMTYKRISDVRWSYGRCRAIPPGERRPPRAHRPRPPLENDAKRSPVAWWPSDCATSSRALRYAMRVSAYIDVRVYGDCPFAARACNARHRECRARIAAGSKFVLAFEDHLCAEYVTELAFRPLYESWGVVPVVLGASDYAETFPPHSYVDAGRYASPEALARRLIYLDANETAFNEYFAWRASYECFAPEAGGCSTCRYAVGVSAPWRASASAVGLSEFFNASMQCVSPDIFYSDILNSSSSARELQPYRRGVTASRQIDISNSDIVLCITIIGLGLFMILRILHVCRYLVASLINSLSKQTVFVFC